MKRYRIYFETVFEKERDTITVESKTIEEALQNGAKSVPYHAVIYKISEEE